MTEPVKGTRWTHPTRKQGCSGDPLKLTVTCVRDWNGKRTVYSRDPYGNKRKSSVTWWEQNALDVQPPAERATASVPRFTKTQARKLFNEAHKAGDKAARAAVPVPMHVVQRAIPLDDSSPIVRDYGPQSEGLCGFAWITVRPGNSSFARWLKDNELGRKAYTGGVDVWVSGYGQSVTRKEAYADAFAAVLQAAGVESYSHSRLD